MIHWCKPDNLMPGLEGKIWLGLVKPRNPAADKLATKPFMWKLTLSLPCSMWPVPKACGHVTAFTEDGKGMPDLQDSSGSYPETTGATKTKDGLFIQSL